MTRHPFVHSSPLLLCIFFAYFILALFSCRTFSRAASSCFRFMSHFFCVALISCCTFFVLHSFQVSLFLCCTLLMLRFSVLHHFQFSLFLSITFAPFFVLHCFDVVPFVHSFHVALFSCCTVFMLHLLVCCLMPHSVHVALFRYSGQQLY